ncbi:AraC family transcriptional regulator [Rhodopirellula sp. JC639]|uniref:AraC family transcriptional regulator n=1 Tax=Stieleria mannarensis TaxID=2755585 RepID=UPI0016033CAD|nr:AraC family transcriptional regulator [Rhodopirellula sp. JC639]
MPNSDSPRNGRAFSKAFVRRHPGVRSVIELFEHLPLVLFYAKDHRQRYIAVNPRTLTDVFGLADVEELYGRTDSDFQPPALADAYHAEDRRVMKLCRSIPNQVWLVPHVRGTPQWYVSTKTPLFSATAEVIGIAGVMYPIATPDEQASFFSELASAIRFIDENYAKPLSIKDLAEMSGLSSSQFNHRFRSLLRMSPSEYILSRRIQDARDRLTRTSDSITDISVAVGFFDQSHFTKRFRRFTGMTPLAYRKRFRDVE